MAHLGRSQPFKPIIKSALPSPFGNAYYMTLSGGLSFSGAAPRSTLMPLTAALSFVGGSILIAAVRKLVATLSFLGDLSAGSKVLTATLSFSGALVRLSSYLVASVLSFAATIHTAASNFTAALSFAGALVRGRNLTAALSFVGSLAKSWAVALSGTLSFVPRLVNDMRLTAVLSFVGTMIRGRLLTGALAFGGAIVRMAEPARTGVLSFSGRHIYTPGITRSTLSFAASLGFKKLTTILGFTAALSLAGSLVGGPLGIKVFKATLGLSGRLVRSSYMIASLALSGLVTRLSGLAPAGGLSFVGTMAHTPIKASAGILSFVGSIGPRAIVALLASALSFVGKTAKGGSRTLVGATLSLSGLIGGHVYDRPIAGGLSFVGAVVRKTLAVFSAAVSFTAVAGKLIPGHLASGMLSFVGSLPRPLWTVVSTATLSFSGSLVRSTKNAMAAALASSGVINRAQTRSVSGGLSFVGMIHYLTTWLLSATLSFVGRLPWLAARALSATLSFVGSAAHGPHIAGVLSFAGSVVPMIEAARIATLSF
ncbi:MAG: hypothetical protein ACRECN_04750, partial [Methylocella sp.]